MWSGTVGLVNGQYKYLTAETFGHKINANGAGLKKKQQWSIEPFPITTGSYTNGTKLDDIEELEHVAIKSHLNCYLAVDTFGNVTCESKERSEGARFTITICSMSQGVGQEQISWAFRNVSRGYYLGATGDGMIQCNAKMPQSRAELWHIHLIPARGATMFALKSIGRKRYARAMASNSANSATNNGEASTEQIQVDSTNAWGSETLFQFKYFEGGKYALLTARSKYLTCDGSCIEWPTNGEKTNPLLPPEECMFTIEYHGGNIAFRDSSGRYLAAAGRASLLRTRSTTVSRDELFEFEVAPIQLALRATFNNRWVSIKQGVDLSANQNETTVTHETFQFEYNQTANCWHISTYDGNYWSLGGASTIQASSKDAKARAFFKIKWNNDDGSCSLLVSDAATDDEKEMKWICARKSGQLYTGQSDAVKFYVKLLNRAALNLRASNASGFVGLKLPGAGKLESNKTTPDSLRVEYANSDNLDDVDSTFNCCYLKMVANNKYLSLTDGNSVVCDATSPACAQQFQIELRNDTCIAIRTFESHAYLNLTNNGAIIVSNSSPDNVTLWEF